MKKIPLANGNGIALVDDEDYENVRQYKWHASRMANGQIYALTCLPGKKNLGMHKVVLSIPNGMCADHINRNPLDNRKKNLRLCTHLQNTWNRRKRRNGKSQFTGIYPTKSGKWLAQISPRGRCYGLGTYESELDAAIVYNVAAQIFFGDFACLNHV